MNFSIANKLAFILNWAFLTAIFMRFYPFLQGSSTQSVILISGLVLAPLTNFVVNCSNFYGAIKGRRPFGHFVQGFNLVALILQITIFLFFTGLLSLSNSIT
jgi:hypothetical protein